MTERFEITECCGLIVSTYWPTSTINPPTEPTTPTSKSLSTEFSVQVTDGAHIWSNSQLSLIDSALLNSSHSPVLLSRKAFGAPIQKSSSQSLHSNIECMVEISPTNSDDSRQISWSCFVVDPTVGKIKVFFNFN